MKDRVSGWIGMNFQVFVVHRCLEDPRSGRRSSHQAGRLKFVKARRII
jgi:hypothetical protein